MNCSWRQRFWAIALIAGMVLPWTRVVAGPPLTYNRDVRPILSDNCFPCHGPDQQHRRAKLRLDVREVAVSRKAIVPGKPDESELIRRIFTDDEDDRMPPSKSEKSLTAAQRETLRRWIAEGAAYEPHWAYIPPVKPPVPEGTNAIDYLVGERLQEIGLEPSPEADRRTLARRLWFDLVGLPPPPEEVEAFERDHSPTAYERLVDRLIESPHYGERMAIDWLDAVRYADTIGYHSDNPRNVWPYRDYVIRSFNKNKPFDQFTREQLAGDLLPNSTLEQKVGSAYNRLLLSTEEGGAQAKDYEARMLTDRVRAVSSAWLGQTMGCAQCHDHKFDPITSCDFYSMGAFFADLKEPILGPREEGMLVPDAEQAANLERLEAELARWRKAFEAPHSAALAAWEQEAKAALQAEPGWMVLAPEEASSESGVKLDVTLDGIVTAEKDPPNGVDTYRIKVRPALNGIVGFRLEALTSDRLPAHGPGRGKDGGFVLTQFSVEGLGGESIELADASATYESPEHPALAALQEEGGWSVPSMGGVAQSIYFVLAEPVDAIPDGTLTLVLQQTQGANAVLGRFRLSATVDPAVVRAPGTVVPPADVAQIVEVAPLDRTSEQRQKLAAYHRSIAPELADLRARLASAEKARNDFVATVPHCLVSVSQDPPRTVRILPRGDFMVETGDVVQPALPAYLSRAAKAGSDGRRLTRLDLANWLVSRDNPLTGRVVINRLWKQFFGCGLSKVVDDFGTQGEPPRNPALLDWLACEFMDSGWDVKHMVRLMVTSHTYRQTSFASKELLSRDPDNRELARQSRWRLEAELVRDNALAIAGLLSPRIGGPSVKPYQPDGYWENLNFPVRTYEPSRGEDQYRRGLYTWWQRSYLHPSLLAFDAPTREECAPERSRSNIPQQALVLLNDPTYVEAARNFAARILREGGSCVDDRITWAWRQALDRAPRPDESDALQALLHKDEARYSQQPAAADALLAVGFSPVPPDLDRAELAAWTSVARVLLNLHETVTRF